MTKLLPLDGWADGVWEIKKRESQAKEKRLSGLCGNNDPRDSLDLSAARNNGPVVQLWTVATVYTPQQRSTGSVMLSFCINPGPKCWKCHFNGCFAADSNTLGKLLKCNGKWKGNRQLLPEVKANIFTWTYITTDRRSITKFMEVTIKHENMQVVQSFCYWILLWLCCTYIWFYNLKQPWIIRVYS